jgi:hypothetical protein
VALDSAGLVPKWDFSKSSRVVFSLPDVNNFPASSTQISGNTLKQPAQSCTGPRDEHEHEHFPVQVDVNGNGHGHGRGHKNTNTDMEMNMNTNTNIDINMSLNMYVQNTSVV